MRTTMTPTSTPIEEEDFDSSQIISLYGLQQGRERDFLFLQLNNRIQGGGGGGGGGMSQQQEDGKRLGPQFHHQQFYGTFQGPMAYSPSPPPPSPSAFPQPFTPPGAVHHPPASPFSAAAYYAHGYQTVPVYAPFAEGRPLTFMARPLPCCGLGIGWVLFFIGFFLAAIPWYVAAFVLLCSRIDYREKPGFIACTIAAVLASIAFILGATKDDNW